MYFGLFHKITVTDKYYVMLHDIRKKNGISIYI